MSRTIEITVFEFDELSDEAKEKARDWYRSTDCWCWQDEWRESAQEFSKIAPIDIDNADYNAGHVNITWTGDDDVAKLTGLRAWKWLHNNGWFDRARKEVQGACGLTGSFGDASLFDPFTEYEKTPVSIPDLKQAFYECAQSWVYEARSDMEYSYSDESVDTNIRANEYQFTEDGKLWT